VHVEQPLAINREGTIDAVDVDHNGPLIFLAKRIGCSSEMLTSPNDSHVALHSAIHSPSQHLRTQGFDFPHWFSAQFKSQ
jgi:hypothetical protein